MINMLTTDSLQRVLSFSTTSPDEFQKNSLVCQKFHDANEKIKYEKSLEFCTHRTSTNEIVRHEQEGVMFYYYVNSYYTLPNGKLHGIHTQKIYKRKLYDGFTEPPIIIEKLFKWGQLDKE